ncbi:hypothetical protein LIER_31590 [Lithospermum erythrorhizon]|uniref:Uncharacterized protein n=1 Tax=Lithospermum erythrorhizon TaxID=34254 RepID=A0AAV3RV84_LITER
MEALNVAGLTQLSVLSDRRKEPRKNVSLPTISAFKKSSNSVKFDEHVSRNLHGNLLFRALCYMLTQMLWLLCFRGRGNGGGSALGVGLGGG